MLAVTFVSSANVNLAPLCSRQATENQAALAALQAVQSAEGHKQVQAEMGRFERPFSFGHWVAWWCDVLGNDAVGTDGNGNDGPLGDAKAPTPTSNAHHLLLRKKIYMEIWIYKMHWT